MSCYNNQRGNNICQCHLKLRLGHSDFEIMRQNDEDSIVYGSK
jgi:hypothetical protein